MSSDLLDRVTVEDHGLTDYTDPETGETWQAYVMSFFVMHEGVEYGVTLSRGEIPPEAEEAFVRSGKLAALGEAGLI